jgi:hypothetical protein
VSNKHLLSTLRSFVAISRIPLSVFNMLGNVAAKRMDSFENQDLITLLKMYHDARVKHDTLHSTIAGAFQTYVSVDKEADLQVIFEAMKYLPEVHGNNILRASMHNFRENLSNYSLSQICKISNLIAKTNDVRTYGAFMSKVLSKCLVSTQSSMDKLEGNVNDLAMVAEIISGAYALNVKDDALSETFGKIAHQVLSKEDTMKPFDVKKVVDAVIAASPALLSVPSLVSANSSPASPLLADFENLSSESSMKELREFVEKHNVKASSRSRSELYSKIEKHVSTVESPSSSNNVGTQLFNLVARASVGVLSKFSPAELSHLAYTYSALPPSPHSMELLDHISSNMCLVQVDDIKLNEVGGLILSLVKFGVSTPTTMDFGAHLLGAFKTDNVAACSDDEILMLANLYSSLSKDVSATELEEGTLTVAEVDLGLAVLYSTLKNREHVDVNVMHSMDRMCRDSLVRLDKISDVEGASDDDDDGGDELEGSATNL